METDIKHDEKYKELVNAIIHGIGILFCIAGIPVLSAIGVKTGNIAGIVGVSIYSFCFLMLFTFSTLYHSSKDIYIKEILCTWDHISIFFLIAGTYTPFLLIYMLNTLGITLLIVQWSLVILGIFSAIFLKERRFLSVIVYVAMGWLLLIGGRSFYNTLPLPVFILIITGGLLYTSGTFFYLYRKFTYSHAIWHLFVLFASICFYAAVLLAITLY